MLESRQRFKRYINFSEIFTSKSSSDVENMVKVTKLYSTLKLVSTIYPRNFGEILTINSRDIVHARNCHANADAVKLSPRPPVTLKMGSKSPKLNQPFDLTQ